MAQLLVCSQTDPMPCGGLLCAGTDRTETARAHPDWLRERETPIPGDMPGYDSQVIMAAGAFVQGSTMELSADGPIREPYAVYFQGGLTWNHAKLGILMSLQQMVDAGLVNL